ncbi:hypothetical protein BG003_008190 [Podila horticola]|nr:hypothetical protein BG003_008190 [Podila horticola]
MSPRTQHPSLTPQHVVLIVLLQAFAPSLLVSQADAQACTLACTTFFTKALFCQNANHFDIPTSIPTIGLDPILDTCLCQQGVIPSMHSCAVCRDTNNITWGDATWVFIDACNREFPNRSLYLPSSAGSLKPLAWSWGSGTLNVYSVMVLFSLAVSMATALIAG